MSKFQILSQIDEFYQRYKEILQAADESWKSDRLLQKSICNKLEVFFASDHEQHLCSKRGKTSEAVTRYNLG